MLGFLVATYNEEKEILDLLNSISDTAKFFIVSDDGSTDETVSLCKKWMIDNYIGDYGFILEDAHTGLPETVKKRGVEFIAEKFGKDAWILMLDADERVSLDTQYLISNFIRSKESQDITHVWFSMTEYIDNRVTRGFLKCRLFRAGFAKFSESVHEDDRFEGQGANFNWTVIHRKTEEKQRMREKEYLQTYKKLLDEKKVTKEWVDRCIGFHYFEKG